MWRFLFRSKPFRFQVWGWELQWDFEYMHGKKTGWTVAHDGAFYVSHLESSLLVAIWKASRMWWIIWRDPSGPYGKQWGEDNG